MKGIFLNLCPQPFSIFNHAFLMAGRTELPTFAGKIPTKTRVAFFTTDPGKPHVEITATKIRAVQPESPDVLSQFQTRRISGWCRRPWTGMYQFHSTSMVSFVNMMQYTAKILLQ